jgi:hypothetical protein
MSSVYVAFLREISHEITRQEFSNFEDSPRRFARFLENFSIVIADIAYFHLWLFAKQDTDAGDRHESSRFIRFSLP